MAPLPSTRTNELHASDRYASSGEQSLLVGLNNEMEDGQSILVNFCVSYFGDTHPTHVARAQKYSYSNEILDRKRGCVHPRHHHQGHPAAELPLIQTWLGTQTKISLSSCINCEYSS